MARKPKSPLPFDSAGGLIAIQRRLVESKTYLTMPSQSKSLMTLLQIHWSNDKPIDYGIREAAEKIPCSKLTAQKAFKYLEERGFITMVNESLFSSRTQSKSRTWKLNWLPYNFKPPSSEWKSN